MSRRDQCAVCDCGARTFGDSRYCKRHLAHTVLEASGEDPVNHPKHYTSSLAKCSKCAHPIECIDVTRHMSFNIGNAMKYEWRADMKGAAVEDLEKAVWYLQDEIKKRKGEV